VRLYSERERCVAEDLHGGPRGRASQLGATSAAPPRDSCVICSTPRMPTCCRRNWINEFVGHVLRRGSPSIPTGPSTKVLSSRPTQLSVPEGL